MKPVPVARDLRVLLFDVGGVLVELRGVDIILGWLGNRLTAEQLWHRWLHSEPVRKFETGRIGEQQFAVELIAEFELAVQPQQFLDSFVAWPTGLFPGTLELLARIPRRYQRALLSNSNALHWPRVLDEMKLGSAVQHHFVSHLMGRIKPDREAFELVLESLQCRPAEVVFFDDNAVNIEAARGLGMHAMHVRGLVETQQALIELGVIDAGA